MTNINDRITEIARKHLFIETLEVQGRDHLDFHSVSVAGVRDALEAAYAAGRASVRPPTATPPPLRGMNKTN